MALLQHLGPILCDPSPKCLWRLNVGLADIEMDHVDASLLSRIGIGNELTDGAGRSVMRPLRSFRHRSIVDQSDDCQGRGLTGTIPIAILIRLKE